jgi:hypothetical protein
MTTYGVSEAAPFQNKFKLVHHPLASRWNGRPPCVRSLFAGRGLSICNLSVSEVHIGDMFGDYAWLGIG